MRHATLHSIETSRAVPPRGHWRILIGSLVAAGATLSAFPRSAAAETTLGVDLAYNDTMREGTPETGAGIDLYVGPRMDLAILTLTTELMAGYHDFGGDFNPSVYRLLAGGRLGIGAVIRPNVFAHLGVGHLRYDDLLNLERDGRTNLAGDIGVGLDFTLLPVVDIGIQASYNAIAGNSTYDPFEWWQGGVHVTFILDNDRS